MSNTIAIYNFKGGVGKTSTTLNLALSWSRFFKILIIDADPQANLTNALLNSQETHYTTLFHLVRKVLHDSPTSMDPMEISPYLHLIAGDGQMAEIEANSQFISFGSNIFYKLLSTFRNNYDFILVDCPTHFGVTVKSFISNCDSILIPAVPDSFSTLSFITLLTYLKKVKKEKQLNILGVFFNLYRKHTLFHKKIVREAEIKFGRIILNQKVRESIRISEAQALGKSIYQLHEESAVAEDFLSLSDEIIGRLNSASLDKLMEEHNDYVHIASLR